MKYLKYTAFFIAGYCVTMVLTAKWLNKVGFNDYLRSMEEENDRVHWDGLDD